MIAAGIVTVALFVAFSSYCAWRLWASWMEMRTLLSELHRRASTPPPRFALGERLWVHHDPLDASAGGVSCAVRIVDDAGVVLDIEPGNPRIQRLP